jgi:UDP-glucuronate 4-epimerase
MSDTVLVTGAGGFIGYHVAAALLAAGRKVVGYDNLCDYYATAVKHARLEELASAGADFQFVEDDLCNLARLRSVFAEHRPGRVCHLAAQAGVRHSLTDPFTYQRSNLEGFLNILECCRHNGVDRLVYASSSSVYGGNTKLPFSEDDPVETPISYYAATKRANELIAHSYTHLYGLQTIGFRFFTVYGPWGRPDMAMWLFAERMLHDEPIKVFNEGRMQRDFTYIDDVVAGVLAALTRSEGLDPFEVMNLGNHRCEELCHMIELIEQALGRPAKRELLPMQPGDVPASFADIERARKKLGFEPRTTLDEGVAVFCDWLLAHPELAETVYQWRRTTEAGS